MLYNSADFRKDIVEVTISGYNDMSGEIDLKSFEDILENLSEELVEQELCWSLGNVIDIVIGNYLKHKGLIIDEDSAFAPSSSFNSSISHSLYAQSTVYYESELKGLNKPIFKGEFDIPIEKFNDDSVIEEVIKRICEEVERALEHYKNLASSWSSKPLKGAYQQKKNSK